MVSTSYLKDVMIGAMASRDSGMGILTKNSMITAERSEIKTKYSINLETV
jgi:hypothetical protein